MCMYVSMHAYVCMYACMHVCMYVCMYVSVCVCVCLWCVCVWDPCVYIRNIYVLVPAHCQYKHIPPIRLFVCKMPGANEVFTLRWGKADPTPTYTYTHTTHTHTHTHTGCRKCTKSTAGKWTCCAKGGSWAGKCGNPGDNTRYTYNEGIEACNRKLMTD